LLGGPLLGCLRLGGPCLRLATAPRALWCLGLGLGRLRLPLCLHLDLVDRLLERPAQLRQRRAEAVQLAAGLLQEALGLGGALQAVRRV